MFERFTERAHQVVVFAQDEARLLRHNYIGTEHLLLGLLREEEGFASRFLDSAGITLEVVRGEVVRIVGEVDEVAQGQIPFTPRGKKVLELSLREAQSLGHKYIGTEHVLLGIARENEGVASQILVESGWDGERIRNEIIWILSAPGRSQTGRVPPGSGRPGSRPRLKAASLPKPHITALAGAALALPLGLLIGWLIWADLDSRPCRCRSASRTGTRSPRSAPRPTRSSPTPKPRPRGVSPGG